MFFIPKVNAQVTNLRVYQRNSNNDGWQLNYDSTNYCYRNVDFMIRGQLIRFLFSETLENDYHYTMNFVITTQNTMDYAWYRWGNDFGSGGILLGSSYISQQPDNGQTINQSYIPFSNYNLYSKTSSITFDVTPSSTNTFALDIPTYLYSYSQICLDSYTIQKGNSQSSEQNTQTIINNNNQNTQNIITNNNNNTNQIINNQNENTDKEIESQKVCTLYDKSYGSTGYLNSSGVVTFNNDYVVTDFVSTDGSTIQVKSTYGNGRLCFYNVDKTYNSCIEYPNLDLDSFVTIPSDAKYVRFTIYKSLNRPTFKVCKSGNQALSDSMQDLNNTLNDTTIEGSSIASQFEDVNVISDTPITDLLTMPLVLLNRIFTQAESTCSPYVLPFNLWGNNNYTITLPCFDGSTYLGSIWTIIDGLMCIFMVYNIGMMIVRFFEKITSLEDVFDITYMPRHGGGN